MGKPLILVEMYFLSLVSCLANKPEYCDVSCTVNFMNPNEIYKPHFDKIYMQFLCMQTVWKKDFGKILTFPRHFNGLRDYRIEYLIFMPYFYILYYCHYLEKKTNIWDILDLILFIYFCLLLYKCFQLLF